MTLSDEHPRLHAGTPGILVPPPVAQITALRDAGMPPEGPAGRTRAGGAHPHALFGAGERPRAFRSSTELLRDLADRGVIVVLAPGPGRNPAARGSNSAAGDRLAALVTHAGGTESRDAVQPMSGAAQARTIFVGDTVQDVESAHHAGFACVGILGAGVSAAELLAAGALAVYADIADLREVLDDSPLAVLWK